ncbi:MAG: polyhydroxyalkanoate depolymerase [Novosphingobium sp.]
MIYSAYTALRRGTRPLGWLLERGHLLARGENNRWRATLAMRAAATLCELPARALKTYPKTRYEVPGEQRVVASLPFADLLNFTGDNLADKPRVLIAAALSGHHATLLQDTVRAFVQDFDTYITDWKDAREVPLAAGDFGFDDYVEYLVRFMTTLGPGTHLVATCQAAPPAMVAAAILAEQDPAHAPVSLTLMGGPVDTSAASKLPTGLTQRLPLWLFEKGNIRTVPRGFPGSGRRVYPGASQLAGFIALNLAPHLRQYARFVRNSLKGQDDALTDFRSFYDEYFSVLDMTERFYLETLRKVFFERHIPRKVMDYRGIRVDFAAVRDLSLLTVEGANDNFCPPGQTEAAHGVFSGLAPERRRNYIQPGVGHYGVFSGSRFRREIYPVIRDFAMKSREYSVSH